ncbi:MAG: hypothetical protein IKD00_03125 [Candidatus Methanomethylophilaceae archaeon]|nr:hypothetical protein [Candidatus Methanomethylophilaceae archaeon]
MCTWEEGKELQRVFLRYYKGKEVREDDLEALDTLSNTDYLEYYMENGKLFARAGTIGKMFKAKPMTPTI